MQLYLCVLLAGLLAYYGVESYNNDCYDEREDCHKLNEQMPDRRVLLEYCRGWSHTDAIKKCRRTCELCHKQPIGPIEGCYDESDECRKITTHFFPNNPQGVADYCEKNQHNAEVQKCKHTCPNLCYRKAPQQACIDELEECRDIVAYGHGRQVDIDDYCYRNRHTHLVQRCKATCRNVCDENPHGAVCRDEADTCRDIYTMHKGVERDIIAYCNLYRENPTVKKCRKTCRRCEVY